jgi:hypothetical protein
MNRKQLIILVFFVITGCYSSSHFPYLGDDRIEVQETLLLACKNYSDYERRFHNVDSAASVSSRGDSLIYDIRLEDVKYVYVFSDGKCESINVKFSCLPCLNKSYRKWLFRGKWKIDEAGYLYNQNGAAVAFMKRDVDCPYLYKVNLTKFDSTLSKEDLKKMKKVDKKLIGTGTYLMNER